MGTLFDQFKVLKRPNDDDDTENDPEDVASNVAAAAKPKLAEALSAASGQDISEDDINDKTLNGVKSAARGAQVLEQSGQPSTNVPVDALKKIDPQSSDKKDSSDDLDSQNKVYYAMAAILPTVLGAAIGGNNGGALGGKATQDFYGDLVKQQQAKQIRQEADNVEEKKQSRELASKADLEKQRLEERHQDVQLQTEARKDVASQHNDTMKALGAGRAADQADKRSTADEKKDESRAKALDADLDFSRGRSGVGGQVQAKVNQAEHLQALVQQYKDGNLPSSQMTELAIGLGSLVGGGNTVAQGTINHIVPQSISGDANKLAAWFTNEPRGTGQQAFVQNLVESVDRQKEVSQQQLDKVRKSRLPAHSAFKNSNPELYRAILAGKGLDEDGEPLDKPESSPLMGQIDSYHQQLLAEKAARDAKNQKAR